MTLMRDGWPSILSESGPVSDLQAHPYHAANIPAFLDLDPDADSHSQVMGTQVKTSLFAIKTSNTK